MARTLNEIDLAVAALELYLGNQAVYTIYGNTLAEALDQYANPVYHELLNADGVYDGVGGSLIVDTPGKIIIQWKGVDVDTPYANSQFIVLAKQTHIALTTIKLVKLNGSLEITEESSEYAIKVYNNSGAKRDIVLGDIVIGHLYSFHWDGTHMVMAGFDASDITSRLSVLEAHKTGVTDYIDYVNGNVYSAKNFQSALGFKGTVLDLSNATSKIMKFNDNGGLFTGLMDMTGALLKVASFTPDETSDHDQKPVPYALFVSELTAAVAAALDGKFKIDDLSPQDYENTYGSLPNGTIYLKKGTVVE